MQHFPATELSIPARYCGPPSSGNGGWSAGALAALIQHDCPDNRADQWPVIEVTLRQPPPLDAAMSVAGADDGSLVATFGGAPVLSARVLDDDTLSPVDEVSLEQARAAESAYSGFRSHPFPGCFACGVDREVGDGLRIFPGVIDKADGLARVASTWTPHPSVQEDFHEYVDEHGRASLAATWAALDCVGGWAGDLEERLMVLGRMTAAVDALPVIGEQHVVVGQGRGQQGRKTFTASTLYDADGRVVARAEHTWIAIDPANFT